MKRQPQKASKGVLEWGVRAWYLATTQLVTSEYRKHTMATASLLSGKHGETFIRNQVASGHEGSTAHQKATHPVHFLEIADLSD